MKANSKLITFGLAAVLSLSVGVSAPQVGPLGVDVVSAATSTPAPKPATPAPKPATPAPKPATPAPKPATPAPKPATPAAKPAPTPAPTASTTATAITRVLVRGSRGNDVKLLQTLLNENGFNLAVDGSFGPLTLGAVKSYQAKNNLKVDGFVGPQTRASLFDKKDAPVVPPVTKPVDVVSSASLPATIADFEKGISENGRWIITPLNDIVTEKELVVEGTFYSKDDVSKGEYRKIGFYTQDENKKVVDLFTLTAPKLTIKSPNTRLQNGTYVTDIYVEAEGFNLVGAKVEGNIVFASKEAQDTFKMDDASTISGQELQVDVVTSASLPATVAQLEKGISEKGRWIVTPVNDIVTEKELIIEGTFYNKDDVTSNVYRKIGFYSQATVDGKKVVDDEYTLTAPKLTIKSPNTRLQQGTYVTDIYVEAEGFNLVGAKVEGNIIFASKEVQDTFKMDDASSISGQELQVDAVTSASLPATVAQFEKGISENGRWIVTPLNDIVTEKELVVEGTFYNKDDESKGAYRKIGFYTQEKVDGKNVVVDEFTLTAPKLTIKSPYTKLQNGTFVTDIYVEANNFELAGAKIEGNIYFTTLEAKESFVLDAASSVTGVQEVKSN